MLFGKLGVYIEHRCCATIGVWLFLIFVAHYKIVRRERSISGLRAGIKIPVGLRNAPAGAVTVPGLCERCREATEETGRCLRAVRAADGRVIPCAEPKIYAMFQLSGGQRAGRPTAQ